MQKHVSIKTFFYLQKFNSHQYCIKRSSSIFVYVIECLLFPTLICMLHVLIMNGICSTKYIIEVWEYLFKSKLINLKVYFPSVCWKGFLCFVLIPTTTMSGPQEPKFIVSFFVIPDFQGLMMAVIKLMMLMTVIMWITEVFKTGKMKNLIFERSPFKLSFHPFSPFLHWQ